MRVREGGKKEDEGEAQLSSRDLGNPGRHVRYIIITISRRADVFCFQAEFETLDFRLMPLNIVQK